MKRHSSKKIEGKKTKKYKLNIWIEYSVSAIKTCAWHLVTNLYCSHYSWLSNDFCFNNSHFLYYMIRFPRDHCKLHIFHLCAVHSLFTHRLFRAIFWRHSMEYCTFIPWWWWWWCVMPTDRKKFYFIVSLFSLHVQSSVAFFLL